MNALVKRLEAASYAYHNGQTLLMTDAEFDAGVDQLRALDPKHPFLSKVGAPIATGDEVILPIPLPSLNKVKDQMALTKWGTKCNGPTYHVSCKLDGCSALWIPKTKKLYTRGDGVKGRDISAFIPYFQGLLDSSSTDIWVRGELIMRTDSTAIPTGKLARNIVAGALNRKEADPALFKEIRFVAYSLESPQLSPEEGFQFLRTAGFETARAAVIPAADLTSMRQSQIFTTAEEKSPYQLDGIVIAPNTARSSTYKPELRGGAAVNPGDRVAWKTRLTAETARTTVREVEWNVSYQGFLIPRVLFDTVTLAGANIGAATGLHGRWIYDNGVGPGAEIEVRRAGDVIPQIIAVHTKAPGGPAMPAQFAWAATDSTCIHIKPFGNQEEATGCVRLVHALGELGAENVGPGLVAKLYAAGLTTLKQIYGATVSDLAARVEGCKEKGAERLWQGLRAKQQSWTELNFMVASATMPRSVGHAKLTPLLALNPNPATWTAAALKAKRPSGLSESTIDAIVEAIPAYLAWKTATGLTPVAPIVQGIPVSPIGPQYTIVFTGVRDKAFEEKLQAKGHVIADTVTKKTTHVIHADGSATATSTKIIKAQELGITLLTLSEAKTIL